VSATATHNSRVFSLATGTLVSRLTGLFRVLVLAWVLGFSPLADSFNLANTVPNMLFDLVLGGVLSATFIPVFVERLAIDGERKAWRSISTIVTAALGVLVVASALAWLLAPYIIDGFTAFTTHHAARSTAELLQQRHVATSFLRWFVPQIFFYGVIGISTALLNVRQRFAAGAWTPIANNIVCCGVLIWFHVVDPSPTLANVSSHSHLLWLGLGTSLGVLAQFLCLLPSLFRADLWRLSFRFNPHDPALAAVRRLGTWTLMVVLTNQISLYVVLAFAFAIGGSGPVSAYTYGWTFMQMPYAVVVVSVLNALTPQLAGYAARDEREEFSQRLAYGLRQSLVIIVPLTLVLIVLAQPIVAILLHHANATHRLLAGTVLAVLAAGLPGFTIFQLAIRGLQAMQRARDTFFLYLGQNALTVVFALAFGRHSMAGLTASVSIAYAVAAVVALVVLGRQRVHLAGVVFSVYVRRTLWASLASGVAMVIVYNLKNWDTGVGLVTRFAAGFIAGVVVYTVWIGISQRLSSPRRQKM